jgi:hypothetical protein
MVGPYGVAHPHDLPALCRAGKIFPAPSFLATRVFYMTRVAGTHPLLEWFAVYVYESNGLYLEVRAVEPETYIDPDHPKKFDPNDPSTFALTPQAEIQYQLPTRISGVKVGQLVQSVVLALLTHELLPDRDTSQDWYAKLDTIGDNLVWT